MCAQVEKKTHGIRTSDSEEYDVVWKTKSKFLFLLPFSIKFTVLNFTRSPIISPMTTTTTTTTTKTKTTLMLCFFQVKNDHYCGINNNEDDDIDIVVVVVVAFVTR